MFFQTPVELFSLIVGKTERVWIFTNALPKIIDQAEALFHGQVHQVLR